MTLLVLTMKANDVPAEKRREGKRSWFISDGDFIIVKDGIKLDIKMFKNDDAKAIEAKINSIIYP